VFYFHLDSSALAGMDNKSNYLLLYHYREYQEGMGNKNLLRML
jgi:hypothetical protein